MFTTLPDRGNEEECEKAEDTLNKHYIVRPNTTCTPHKFRKLEEEEGETILQLVSRLTEAKVATFKTLTYR